MKTVREVGVNRSLGSPHWDCSSESQQQGHESSVPWRFGYQSESSEPADAADAWTSSRIVVRTSADNCGQSSTTTFRSSGRVNLWRSCASMGPDEPCARSPQSACADERATQWPQKSSSTVSRFCPGSVREVSDSGFSRFDPGAANVLEVLDFCTDSVGVSSALSRLFSMGWNGFDSRRLHH